jgi:opacity protein-like surface antigen
MRISTRHLAAALVMAWASGHPATAHDTTFEPLIVSVTDTIASSAGGDTTSAASDCGRDAQRGDGTTCGASCEWARLDARVAWVYLRRDRADSVVVFSDPAGVPLLNSSDFDFQFRPGLDAGLLYNLSCDCGVDVRYLWLDPSTATARFDVPPGANTVNTTPPTVFGGPTSDPATFQYSSALQTVEVSLRKNLPGLGLLAGFRYADFNETMSGLYPFGGGFSETNTWGKTQNSLYGFQVGADGILWGADRRLQIDGFAKAGIYGNHGSTSFLRLPTPKVAFDEADHAAFLGELGLGATYQLTSHVALRAGYQLLILSGVAVAGDQVPVTGKFNGGAGPVDATIDLDGRVLYHGALAGIEVTW